VWNRTTEPSCTTLTSARSNVLVMPVFSTVTWSSVMTVTTPTYEVPQTVHLIIPSGATLEVESSVTMIIRGTVTNNNNGTLINAGVIHVFGSLVNNGTFTNRGTVTNYSSNSVTNNGTLTNEGVIENKLGGVIENKAGGTLTNNGTFNNDGTFQKSDASTFNGRDITGNPPVRVPAPAISPLAWQAKGYLKGVADERGQSVSLSSGGSIVAIGTPSANSKGVVQIYTVTSNNNSTLWTLMGLPIEGERVNERSGTSVSLSSDGHTVAIGAPGGGALAPKGITRIYKWTDSTSTWEPMGAAIEGVIDGDDSGYSVSLSSNGRTVAIGAPNEYDFRVGGSHHGITRIYDWNLSNNSWSLQARIEGINDGNGWSVSLSADGNTVAIGGPFADSGKGVTRMYQRATPNWTIMGSPLPGGVAYGWSGRSVSLSSNGKMVAVGAPNANTAKGETHIYKWYTEYSEWMKFGYVYGDTPPIVGLVTGEQNGYSVSLHSDQDTHTLAICAPGASYMKDKSLIYRYDHDSDRWVAMTKPMQMDPDERVDSACLSSETVVFGASNKGITRRYAKTQ
jgi:hypothetical protein